MRDMALLDSRPQVLLFPFAYFLLNGIVFALLLGHPQLVAFFLPLGFSALRAILWTRTNGQMLIRLSEAHAKPGRPRNSLLPHKPGRTLIEISAWCRAWKRL
jgi:hypothetical protein